MTTFRATFSMEALAYGATTMPTEGSSAEPQREASAGRPPAMVREYVLAMVCVGLTAALRAMLEPLLRGASPLLVFVLPTVVMVTRHAAGPALFATGLSAVVGTGLFVRPIHALWSSNAAQNTRLVLFLAVTLTIVALGVVRRRRRERALQAERLRVVHLTMRTVQDIVNNSLNQLHVLRLEAQDYATESSLTAFDQTIQEMTAKLTVLGNLTAFKEKRMQMGVALDDHPT